MMASPIRIPLLVVEDSDEDFDTVREALKRSNVVAELRRVSSGDECLALLREPGNSQPALILMDLNMPGIDGRETLRLIKTDPLLRGLPVVVMSTSNSPKDLEFCYASGANAYHVKPVRYPEHLQSLVDLLTYWLAQTSLPSRGGMLS